MQIVRDHVQEEPRDDCLDPRIELRDDLTGYDRSENDSNGACRREPRGVHERRPQPLERREPKDEERRERDGMRRESEGRVKARLAPTTRHPESDAVSDLVNEQSGEPDFSRDDVVVERRCTRA